MDIQTRTWVGIDLNDLTVEYEPDPHGSPMPWMAPSVSFTLSNFGQTPAQNVWWDFDYATDMTVVPTNPFNSPQCKKARATENTSRNINIFPHDKSEVQYFSIEQARLHATNILGCIVYQGVAEKDVYYSVVQFPLPPLEHGYGHAPDVFHVKARYFRAK